MEYNAAEKPSHTLVRDERGVIRTAGALLTDASGHCQVSAGSDIFPVVFTHGVFVDTSLLIRDIASMAGGANNKVFTRS